MDAALVDEISTACNITVVGMRTGLRAYGLNMPADVHAAFMFYKANLVPLINAGTEGQRTGQLRDLLRYLNEQIVAGTDTAKQRALMLVRWNKLFNLTGLRLTDGTCANAATCVTIITEIFDTGQAVSVGFRAFCAATPNAHQAVYQMRQRFVDAGVGFAGVYNLIHFFHQNLFDFARLTPPTCVEIYRLSGVAPPRGGFAAGFPDWGPGNHGDVETNKTEHFFKHVLDADPAPLAWKDEMASWWQTLNIALTRNIARANMPALLFNLVTAQFPVGDDAPLVNANVVAFLGLMRLNNAWGVAIRDWFRIQYRTAYVDYALDSGRNLTAAKVHTTPAGGLFVSGQRGSIFVVGRLHNGALGISSCYVAQDINVKLAARVDIWPLDP